MRKWKSKLKEWSYKKYSKAEELNFIVSKARKMKAEGKDTIFFFGEEVITNEKIKTFKKRRLGNKDQTASPIAGTCYVYIDSVPSLMDLLETPGNLTYLTPRPETEETAETQDAPYIDTRQEELRQRVSDLVAVIRSPAGCQCHLNEVSEKDRLSTKGVNTKPEALRRWLDPEKKTFELEFHEYWLSTGPVQEADILLEHTGRSNNLARDLQAMNIRDEEEEVTRAKEREEDNSGKEDYEMEDAKSNLFGVTYTESVITGISWNYSAPFG